MLDKNLSDERRLSRGPSQLPDLVSGGAAVTEIIATLPAVRPLMPMSVRISTCPSVRQVNARQGDAMDASLPTGTVQRV